MAAEPTTGLLITREAVEWTTVQGSGPGAAARRRVERPAPEAAAGEAAGAAAAAEALRAACRDITGSVTLALPSEDVLLRVVDLPAADASETAAMVALQADKFSPFPVDNMVVAHEVLSRGEGGARVAVATARLDAVQALGDLLAGAGIECARVDVEALGWWRLLAASGAFPAEGRHAAVIVARGVPTLIVCDGGVPVLFRAFGESGDLAGEALAEELAREAGYALMSLELERGSPGQSSVTVYQRAGESAPFVERMRARCGCAVNSAAIEALGFATEGVARRAADRAATVDLTPETWRATRQGQAQRRRMIPTASAVAAAWLLAFGGFAGAFLFQGRRLAWLRAEQQRWREPANEVRAARRRVAMIRRYMDRTHSALECLREISVLQPEGVDQTSFQYRKGEGVKVTGVAADVNQVYTFKQRLDESPLFLETRLLGPRAVRETGRQAFDLDMTLPGDGPEGGGS